MVIALTETKGNKKPFTVKPLKESARKADAPGADGAKVTGPQTATQAPSLTEPGLIQVPELPDGKGSDWRAWLQTIGAAIDAATTVALLNGWVAENQPPINSLRTASDKQHGKLMEKIEARRVALTGEIPSDQ
jgi:hypothetical protein